MVKGAFRRFAEGVACVSLLAGVAFAEDEPDLPLGLGEAPQEESAGEPELPLGLEPEDGQVGEAPSKEEPAAFPLELSGFCEARGGFRTQNDPYQKDTSLGETRLQLELSKVWTGWAFKVTSDFLYDSVLDDHEIQLEEGKGWVDLREANLSVTPIHFLDVKLGRQILTWGTGDMLFINDMFPKDWNSFFIGRDPEYLKAPSDAVKMSFFADVANLDFVYTPRFDSDRYIDGTRISYWSRAPGRLAGRDAVVEADKPDDWFDDEEIAWRLYKNVSGYELAAYGYQGFWKSPGGADPFSGEAIFPKLSVYGASVRGNALNGIGNIEVGCYDSHDDSDGDNPFIRNSEFRFLIGYEREMGHDFTVGLQYYLEHMFDHDNYLSTLPESMYATDENRHVLTLRLTKLLMRQNLRLSLFAYYSPSDQDAYLRPNVKYKLNDNWSAEMGGNVFLGEHQHTFFGQFQNNSNVYAGVRYAF